MFLFSNFILSVKTWRFFTEEATTQQFWKNVHNSAIISTL